MQSISLVFFFFCFTATGIFGFSPPDSGIALVNQVEDDVPYVLSFLNQTNAWHADLPLSDALALR